MSDCFCTATTASFSLPIPFPQVHKTSCRRAPPQYASAPCKLTNHLRIYSPNHFYTVSAFYGRSVRRLRQKWWIKIAPSPRWSAIKKLHPHCRVILTCNTKNYTFTGRPIGGQLPRLPPWPCQCHRRDSSTFKDTDFFQSLPGFENYKSKITGLSKTCANPVHSQSLESSTTQQRQTIPTHLPSVNKL